MVEDHVCATGAIDVVLLVVIDGQIGAVREAALALFARAGSDDDAQAGELGQRGRGGADATSAAVNEQRFAGPCACQLEHVQIRGQENLRHGAGFFIRQRVRHVNRRAVMNDDLLRVSAAGEQGHGPFAGAPAVDIHTDFDHLACALQPEDRGSAGRRRIVAFALQEIGAIHRRRAYADAQLIRRQRRRLHFTDPEHRFVAENDSAHNGSECIVSGPMPDVVTCRNLRKYFADVKAVDGLDLSVENGECFGLLGPNGAGKTTTIEILEGLTTPDSGEVEILGLTWRKNERELRERIGISLQETQLTEKLTVFETLRLFRSFYRDGADPEELLRELSLDEKHDARVGKLSGGPKQRLAVACALVGNPDVLFLDEPTTGLDPQSRLQLWDIVQRFRQKGGTVLLTTHYMEEAERLCDRVAIVDHGHLIALGTPAELIAKLEARNVIEFTSEPRLEQDVVEAINSCAGATPHDDGWLLRVHSLAEAVPQLIGAVEKQGAKLVSLSTHEATLEDLFVSLTGRELRDA